MALPTPIPDLWPTAPPPLCGDGQAAASAASQEERRQKICRTRQQDAIGFREG